MVQIIFLNGPTSSGKTSIAKGLQEELDRPFLHLSIDQMIAMMPEKTNNWTGGRSQQGFWWEKREDAQGSLVQEIQAGPFAKKVWQTFQETVCLFAKLGHDIIVDEVAFGNTQILSWKEKLKDFNVLWVGLFAPLSVLEERELKRKDRMIGSARAQHQKVHAGVVYDLSIDSSKKTLRETIVEIKEACKISLYVQKLVLNDF